jgi:hypothetical protein
MPIEPDDAELHEEVHRSFMLDVHTCLPAITRSYDSETQRGTFLPVVKGSVKDADGNNVFEQRPEIQNVPVRWERAGGYYEHKPLAVGDHGWLLFSEDSYAHWRATGELSEPGDLTRHSISYPFFLPGAWPDDNPLPDAPAESEAVYIVPEGGWVRVSKAGNSEFAHFVALASKVDGLLGFLDTAITSAASTEAGAGGLGGMTALKSALGSWLSSVAATSLKSD